MAREENTAAHRCPEGGALTWKAWVKCEIKNHRGPALSQGRRSDAEGLGKIWNRKMHRGPLLPQGRRSDVEGLGKM
eukprot:gene16829-biopygen11337